MILIDNEYYYLDLKEIENFILTDIKNNEFSDEELILDKKGDVIQRKLFKGRENNEKYINLRYDIIKTMLDVTYNGGIESENGNVKYTQDLDESSVGTKLAFNTLLVNGFIKNKLNK